MINKKNIKMTDKNNRSSEPIVYEQIPETIETLTPPKTNQDK